MVRELYAHECVLGSAREAKPHAQPRSEVRSVACGWCFMPAPAKLMGERVCGSVRLLSRDSAKPNYSDAPGFGGAAGKADSWGWCFG